MIYKSAFSGGGHFTIADGAIVKVDLIHWYHNVRHSLIVNTMASRRLGILLFACLWFVLYCTSPSIVHAGIAVDIKSKYSTDRLPRLRFPRSYELHKVTSHPTSTKKGQLHSRTGYFLEILENGTIQATLNNSSIYTILEMQTYNKTLKRFFGCNSDYYLAYEVVGKRRGKFIGERQRGNNSLFIEHHEENGYLTYRLLNFNTTGFLAIKDNGKFRRVERSRPGMHASQFYFL